MKKLIYLFAATLLLSVWSCSEDDNKVDDPNDPGNHPDNVELELSTRDLVFEAQGGDLTFDITCNTAWTITNESDWCTLDKTSGNGNATVKVTTGVYEENEDRNTVLTVKAGDVPQTLTVTQKHEDALILSKDKFDVSQKGENITIEARSNIECSLTIPSRFQNWISETPKGKGMEDITFNLTIAENEEFESREGFVIISGNALKDTVYVYQAQKDQLILMQDTYNITSEEQNITAELRTNIDYDITIPDSVSSWVSLLETKASRTDKLNLSIAANEDTDSRSALVLIKDKNSELADTLYINQTQKDAFFFVQDEYNVKAEGETIVVELLHNLSPSMYTAYTSNADGKWLNILPMLSSKALTSEKMQIVVSPNESLESRQGKVIFYSNETDLSDTIKIYQAARSEMIIEQKEFTIQGQGGNISVKLQSNTDYEVNIAEDAASWISQVQTKALTESTLTFHVEANTTSETRIGEIEIKDKNSSLADTIRISQGTSDTYAGDVVLTTIDEVKAFAETKCKKIDGSLTIEGHELTTLAQLNNQLEEIRDSLIVNCRTMINLDGLYGLKKVGGNINIKDIGSNTLEGLNNLESIGGDLEIHGEYLTSLKGLNSLQSIGRSLRIYHGNYTSFEGIESLISIGKNLEINGGSSYLTSFKGLDNLQNIPGSLRITGCSCLTSFDGLENLKNIGENFELSSNTEYGMLSDLISFEGLKSLTHIGGNFKINARNMNSLTSFKGLENLASIGGDFEINVLMYATHTSGGYVGYSYSLQSLISFEGLEALASIGRDFRINVEDGGMGSLVSFKGLESLASIGRNFEINASHFDALESLASFEGLESLSSIGGNFKINYDSYALTSFEGLGNLTSISGNFTCNAELKVEDYLSKLTTIGGNISLNIYTYNRSSYYNANFSSLESIGGTLSLNGEKYQSYGTLSLPSLQTLGGECTIEDFDMLDFPNVESIAGALTIRSVNSIGNLDYLKSVGDITISGCSNLYDFCNWKPVLTDYNGAFVVTGCGYNPTKYQILNGECSQTPEN